MNTKLEFLSRKNRGKTMLPQHIDLLTDLLDMQIDENNFLNLELSDKIRSSVFKASKRLIKEKKSSVLISSEDFVESIILNEYLADFRRHDIMLITKFSEYYGLIKLNFEDIIGKIVSLIKYDGDTITIFSKELNLGFMIDFYEEHGRFFYELIKIQTPLQIDDVS